jgi:ubiquinone/menaquinone biosynthesis C-methylase UbiE
MLEVRELLAPIVSPGGTFIDLGCGSGQALDSVADLFQERIGLDSSRARLAGRHAEHSASWEFREADLNQRFPLDDESADAVLANQVIEHVVDPGHFCAETHRILRKGGVCVVTTPNIRSFKNLAHLIFSGYGPRTAGGNTMDGTWDDGHLHYFTHHDLRELFIMATFERVESRALIDLSSGTMHRRVLNRFANAWPVREFISGNILLLAHK